MCAPLGENSRLASYLRVAAASMQPKKHAREEAGGLEAVGSAESAGAARAAPVASATAAQVPDAAAATQISETIGIDELMKRPVSDTTAPLLAGLSCDVPHDFKKPPAGELDPNHWIGGC